MLDLKNVAQHFDDVVARLRSRGGGLDLGPFQKLVQERRELYVAMEALNLKRKSKEQPKDDAARTELRGLSQEIKAKENRIKEVEDDLSKILFVIPNVPDATVPVG